MKRVNLVIIVVLGLALLLSACGGASNKLVVGTSADYPPYEFKGYRHQRICRFRHGLDP